MGVPALIRMVGAGGSTLLGGAWAFSMAGPRRFQNSLVSRRSSLFLGPVTSQRPITLPSMPFHTTKDKQIRLPRSTTSATTKADSRFRLARPGYWLVPLTLARDVTTLKPCLPTILTTCRRNGSVSGPPNLASGYHHRKIGAIFAGQAFGAVHG